MEKLGPSPFLWLEFDKEGNIDEVDFDELKTALASDEVTDLVVISHGWKNTKADAQILYGTLWANACKSLPPSKAASTLVAGIVWPAKAYRTDFDAESLAKSAGEDGAALGHGGQSAVEDLDENVSAQVLADFEDLFADRAADTIAAAKDAMKGITTTNAFNLVAASVDLVSSSAADDAELREDARRMVGAAEDPAKARVALSGLATPLQLKLSPEAGAAQGLGDAADNLIGGARAAVARFLNQLTYYEMKKRAGVVGKSLATTVLNKLTRTTPVKLHLVGHSFGARLVTAAANEFSGSPNVNFYSLTLLQGAFSHNALAVKFDGSRHGAFPQVVGKPTGPISATHTHNDLACTLAYAIASRLSRDMTLGIGDRNDKFGAIGANGPQHLPPEVVVASDSASVFKPQRKKVNTFLANEYIVKTPQSDAHNNVTNRTVGQLLAAVIES